MQLGALVATARVAGPADAALITMLGLLGLRVSEACNANIEDLGNKPEPIPLPVRVARDRHANYIVAAFIAGAA
jgi:integrase/recombinase XerD